MTTCCRLPCILQGPECCRTRLSLRASHLRSDRQAPHTGVSLPLHPVHRYPLRGCPHIHLPDTSRDTGLQLPWSRPLSIPISDCPGRRHSRAGHREASTAACKALRPGFPTRTMLRWSRIHHSFPQPHEADATAPEYSRLQEAGDNLLPLVYPSL